MTTRKLMARATDLLAEIRATTPSQEQQEFLAEAWLQSQPSPPRQAVIQIAGESYLAAYHPNINPRSIYPFSIAAPVEESKEQDQESFGEPSPRS